MPKHLPHVCLHRHSLHAIYTHEHTHTYAGTYKMFTHIQMDCKYSLYLQMDTQTCSCVHMCPNSDAWPQAQEWHMGSCTDLVQVCSECHPGPVENLPSEPLLKLRGEEK